MSPKQHVDGALDKFYKNWKGISATVLSIAAMTSMCWSQLAKPAIQDQIDKSIDPMRKAIVMLLCYKEAETDSTTKARAEYLYQRTLEWDRVKGR